MDQSVSFASLFNQRLEAVMRTSAATENHPEVIKEFYLEPDGVRLIQEMTGLSYGTITSYALKRFA